MIIELIGKNLGNELDPEVRIDSLELNIRKFPFITNSINFQQFLLISYVSTIFNYFEKGNPITSLQILARFEKCAIENKLLDTNYGLISNIYLQLASYYNRLHYYDSQENILKRGLKLLPDSKELKSNLNTLLSNKTELMEYARNNNFNTQEKAYTLDNESILVLKEIASKKRKLINDNVDKYLMNKVWQLENIVVKNSIVTLSPKEQVTFIFGNDNSAKIKDNVGESLGSWNYNRKESTIRVYDSKDSATTNIMIYEIDSSMIKSIMFNDDNPVKMISFLKSL